MTDYASLVLRVESLEARTATRDLKNLAKQGGITQTATASLTGFIGGLAGSLLSAAAAGMALSKAISVQRQFDVINAGLLTATGSADGAALAFEALSDFAAQTPYDLAQVSDSFIKLVNLGLDPSERALRSYGNTASAMGKDLNMMIEAVADAATGEFERLKEFGIKSKSEGDKVTFTFQGVKTTIGKNAAEIEQYLMAIGETKFGDSMANRMASLDGKLSNLADSWDATFRNIMATSIGDGIEDMVDASLVALEDLNDYLASGEFEGHMAQLGAAFQPFVEDAQEALDIIWKALQDQNSKIEGSSPELERILTSAWRDFPENVRALVQLATTYFAANVEELKILAQGLADSFKAIFNDDTIEAAMSRRDAALKRNTENYKDSVSWIMEERDATQAAQDAAAKKAEADRAEYERKKREKPTGDRLAGFRIGADQPQGASDAAADKAAATAAKKRARELEGLRSQLQTEEEEIASSYAEREAIIAASLQKGSAEQIELSRRSLAARDEELAKLAESRSRDFDNLQDALMSEEEAIQDSYDRRIAIINENSTASDEIKQKLRDKVESDRQQELADFAASQQAQRDQLWQGLLTEQEMMTTYHEQRRKEILEATFITEMERQELLRREESRFMKESADRERHRISMITGSAGEMFGALAGLMQTYAQGSDKQSKKMFKVAQAFSIAQAVISIATGISKAQELGYPMNIFESVRVAAVGAAQIATIKSQQYSGSYDLGGQIPAGKWGWVGEAGPERVRGPAMVTGRKISERDSAGGGATSVSVMVNLNSDGSGSTETKASAANDDVQTARELGNLVGAKVREVLDQEQRPGGRLWRMKHG